jgi:hypothetical protein
MRQRAFALLTGLGLAFFGAPVPADSPVAPPWAFTIDPALDRPVPPGGPLQHVPNSRAAYTLGQIADFKSGARTTAKPHGEPVAWPRVRQLYDMQHGFRNGLSVALMMPVVAKLTEEDIVNIVAYTASRAP